VGDIVMVRERSKALPFFTGQVPRWLPSVTAPSWIELDKATMSGTVKSQPAVEESGIQQSDLQAIIEYYSR
jgi:ribosomal protein S4